MNTTDEMVASISKHLFTRYINYRTTKKEYPLVNLPLYEIDGVRISSATLCVEPDEVRLHINLMNHDDEVFSNLVNSYSSWELSLQSILQKTTSVYKCGETRAVDLLSFSLYGIECAVRETMNTLETLRYNVNLGYFTTYAICDDKVNKALILLVNRGKCKSRINECCVCYETTKTKTKGCNHTMCGRCISNMPSAKMDCPLCRSNLWNNGDEEEEE